MVAELRGGKIYVYNDRSNPVGSYTAGKWHNFKVFLDLETRRLDLYIDDVKVTKYENGDPFNGILPEISRTEYEKRIGAIEFMAWQPWSGSTLGECFIDDIKISYPKEEFIIEDTVFYDNELKNENKIEDKTKPLAAGEKIARVNVFNNDAGGERSITTIMCLYKDGQLMGLSTSTAENIGTWKGASLLTSICVPHPADGYTIKLFKWEDLQNITPLNEPDIYDLDGIH